MREVIKWVNAPLAASAVMIGMADTVNHGITHHDIWVRHINLQAQYVFTIFELAITHVTKER